jgi:hypothetical protein
MFHTVEKARCWATIGRSIAQYGREMLIVISPTGPVLPRIREASREQSEEAVDETGHQSKLSQSK